EDGIRDRNVTGVQTCALPILTDASLEHVAAMGQVESLLLTGIDQLTDAGLLRLAALPRLRRFAVGGSRQISDAGLAIVAGRRDLGRKSVGEGNGGRVGACARA